MAAWLRVLFRMIATLVKKELAAKMMGLTNDQGDGQVCIKCRYEI